jgi:hypothetical protein
VSHTVFGGQVVRTRVYHVLPVEIDRLDVSALLDEARTELGRAERTEPDEAWVI